MYSNDFSGAKIIGRQISPARASGLALVKELVELHRGEILRCRAKPEKARFSLNFR
ncbi:MAG: hypothetical protein R3C26_05955 [Calditrichia bacterium]